MDMVKLLVKHKFEKSFGFIIKVTANKWATGLKQLFYIILTISSAGTIGQHVLFSYFCFKFTLPGFWFCSFINSSTNKTLKLNIIVKSRWTSRMVIAWESQNWNLYCHLIHKRQTMGAGKFLECWLTEKARGESQNSLTCGAIWNICRKT